MYIGSLATALQGLTQTTPCELKHLIFLTTSPHTHIRPQLTKVIPGARPGRRRRRLRVLVEVQVRPAAGVLAFRLLGLAPVHVVRVVHHQIIVLAAVLVARPTAAVAAAGRVVPQVGVELALLLVVMVAAGCAHTRQQFGRRVQRRRAVLVVLGALAAAALGRARVLRIGGRGDGARRGGRRHRGHRARLRVQRLHVQLLHPATGVVQQLLAQARRHLLVLAHVVHVVLYARAHLTILFHHFTYFRLQPEI